MTMGGTWTHNFPSNQPRNKPQPQNQPIQNCQDMINDCQCPSSLLMFLAHFQLMTNNRTSNVLPKPITKMPILLISPSPTFLPTIPFIQNIAELLSFFSLIKLPYLLLAFWISGKLKWLWLILCCRVLNKWSQFDFGWEGFTYFNIKGVTEYENKTTVD